MRKSSFTEAKIVAMLREGEAGVPIVELLRKHGVSRPTYYLWKQKAGGAGVPELQRLKQWEQENAQRKRRSADMALENAAIKDGLHRKLSRCPRGEPSRPSGSPRTVCRLFMRVVWRDARGRRIIARHHPRPMPMRRLSTPCCRSSRRRRAGLLEVLAPPARAGAYRESQARASRVLCAAPQSNASDEETGPDARPRAPGRGGGAQ